MIRVGDRSTPTRPNPCHQLRPVWHRLCVTVDRLRIRGLRAFAESQELEFSLPQGRVGSGITVLVGPTGGGKSTVLEALRACAADQAVSFSMGTRNIEAGDLVEIVWTATGGTGELRSVKGGSSETIRRGDLQRLDGLVHLSSRRSFQPYFGESIAAREQYAGGYQLPTFRSQPIEQFAGRLFKIERQGPRDEFDRIVERIAGSPLDWSIDRQESGLYFVKVKKGNGSHSSDGLGEGTVSVLFLADALYDSSPGDIIVIDEPGCRSIAYISAVYALFSASTRVTDRSSWPPTRRTLLTGTIWEPEAQSTGSTSTKRADRRFRRQRELQSML
ncbi:hypothetical protein BH24ACT2_BH24ACT2_07350 [soil metagenome]